MPTLLRTLRRCRVQRPVEASPWPAIDSTNHRTSAPARSPLVAARALRPDCLRRERLGASTFASRIQGQRRDPRQLSWPVDQHNIVDQRARRKACPPGGPFIHQPHPRVHGCDDSGETRRCVDNRGTARDREAGGRGSPFRTDGAPALKIRRRSIAPPATSPRRIGRDRKVRMCGMLGDHELEALRDIERRLRWDSPELARLFSTVEPCQRRVAASVHGQECSWRRRG